MSMDEFNANYDEWNEAAEKALRGKPVSSLDKQSYDGINIQALYNGSIDRDQAQSNRNGWCIHQAINHPDVNQAKKFISEDLMQGVNGLSLYSKEAKNALGFGLDLSADSLKTLFSDTYLEMIDLRLESGVDEFELAEILLSHYQASGLFEKNATLSLGIDPIAKMAQFGGHKLSLDEIQDKLVSALSSNATYALRADGRSVHDGGASEALEIAFILSSATQYLKWADEAGIALDDAAAKIELAISSTQNQFMSLAKIRTLRQLWAELLNALEIKQSHAHIFAQTSYRMSTKRDPWVNILRNSVAAFSAGIGGADQISILPQSATLGLATSFDRRINRHIQTILAEESNLAAVVDPAKGSAYVETLTQSLIEKSWAMFQKIESAGGVIEALKTGLIQSEIKTTNEARQADLAKRIEPITGTSEFPNLIEDDYVCEEAEVQTITSFDKAIEVEAIGTLRDAEIFEAFRDRSDAALKASGKRPNIFIAKIGAPKDYLARSTFVKNAFEVGGIETIEGEGGTDAAHLVEEFKQSGSSFAVIASADGLYESHAAEFAKALKEAGAKYVYMAGKARGDDAAAYEAAGIDAYIFVRQDLVAVLNDYYSMSEGA